MNNELQVNKNYYESDFEPMECPRCHGTGYKAYWAGGEDCPKCNGTGKIHTEGIRKTMGSHMDKSERNNSDVIKWLFQW